MLKAVFDSTIIVSALLTPSGLTGRLIERARAGEFSLLLSQGILDESRATLHTNKGLQRKYRYSDEEVAFFFSRLQSAITLVSDLPTIQVVRDPNDDFILATAVKAGADYLVARDNDLLTLGAYQAIRIITPNEFAVVLGATLDQSDE